MININNEIDDELLNFDEEEKRQMYLNFFKSSFEFLLCPALFARNVDLPPLQWTKVKYDQHTQHTFPPVQGVYMFMVSFESQNLPTNSYVMYVGKAGDTNSANTIAVRFRDYVNPSGYADRVRVKKMIKHFSNHLFYYYAPIPQGQSTSEVEQTLADIFAPPCCVMDFSAHVRNSFKRGQYFMKKRLVLPCLRGRMGSWITYSCMMRLSDVADLVNFAKELHQINKLSDKIQRELNDDRAKEISEYLVNNDDRFFNSLVVAIYDGDPVWHDIGGLKPNNQEAESLEFPEYAQNCLGFLSVTKEEKLFALDGQHRLAGIKDAVLKDDEIANELINIIIVAHSNTEKGKIRSRRLFTTLNKKAKLVSKDAIIALDEDDISACITRKLIESSNFKFFNENNVSFSSGPVRDKTSITSIVNIYDNTQKLVSWLLKTKISDLDKLRFKDNIQSYDFVENFFRCTFEQCKELSDAFADSTLVGSFRDSETGGHLLFRPIGWDIYTDIFISGLDESPPEKSTTYKIVSRILKNNLMLNGDILSNKVWSTRQKKIMKVSAKNIKIIERKFLL